MNSSAKPDRPERCLPALRTILKVSCEGGGVQVNRAVNWSRGKALTPQLRSGGPTAAPPVTLTRHVDAREDALGSDEARSDPRGFRKTSRSGSSAASRASTGYRGGATTRLPVAMAALGLAAKLRKQGSRSSHSSATALGPSYQSVRAALGHHQSEATAGHTPASCCLPLALLPAWRVQRG